MKKRMNRFIYVLAALVLFATSCDWEPIMWDSSKTYIAFTTPSTDVKEEGDMVAIVVMVTALDGAPAVTVDFEFDTVGIDPAKAAFEGEEFTLVNDSKTLSFPNGWGYDTIWIMPIDNDIFTGDKLFNITLTSNTEDYAFGAAVTNVVTIKDNEHPLGAWIGGYTVEALSYGKPGDWDETWNVTTSPVEGDITKLSILGIGTAGTTAIIATIDKEEMTITIAPGQDSDAYANYGYTESLVFFGNPDLSLDRTVPLVGTITEDGTFAIDNFAIYVQYEPNPAYNGTWDVWNTTWTKTAKKSGNVVKSNNEKASMIK
jgi:hypothetical protein